MVESLLIKPERKMPMNSVEEFSFTKTYGILGNIPCLPLRQVLIMPSRTLREFKLNPGDLRENIVVNFDHLHDLPSGSVLNIGDAQIRLTFHCEPCGRVKDKVSIAAITHKRGYLGYFLNDGIIRLGDSVTVIESVHEPIPYALKERIVWYLKKQKKPVPVTTMLEEIGLSPSYARAVPNLLRGIPKQLESLIYFKSKKEQQEYIG